MAEIKFDIEKETTAKSVRWIGSVDDQPSFRIGRETDFPGGKGKRKKKVLRRGLVLISDNTSSGAKYDAAVYRKNPKYGFWADFVNPTILAESRYFFHAFNTYDRGKLSFGLMQFASHIPDKNFIPLFRKLLLLPNATDYFPNLKIINGFINGDDGDGKYVQLESETDDTDLLTYFKPNPLAVEKSEALQAARLIYWSDNDARHREIQVEACIGKYQIELKTYADWYPLDGKSDRLCLVVCDIHHQGRGTRKAVNKVFKNGGTDDELVDKLLNVGSKRPDHRERIETLIKALYGDETEFGKRKYDADKGDFVMM